MQRLKHWVHFSKPPSACGNSVSLLEKVSPNCKAEDRKKHVVKLECPLLSNLSSGRAACLSDRSVHKWSLQGEHFQEKGKLQCLGSYAFLLIMCYTPRKQGISMRSKHGTKLGSTLTELLEMLPFASIQTLLPSVIEHFIRIFLFFLTYPCKVGRYHCSMWQARKGSEWVRECPS